MSVRFDTPVALITIWAGLLIIFMVMRPSPYSLSFWLLAGSAMLSGGLYSLTSHMESKRVKRATLAWLQQVNELVDVRDFQDDGHLPEYWTNRSAAESSKNSSECHAVRAAFGALSAS
jgi:hypothetical protein